MFQDRSDHKNQKSPSKNKKIKKDKDNNKPYSGQIKITLEKSQNSNDNKSYIEQIRTTM